MKKILLTNALAILIFHFACAQDLLEKTNIRLHEHHTNEVTVVGGESGYDLVNHRHIEIFGSAPDYNGLTNEERMNVDIHEIMDVNEASTMSFNFGFTSGLDTFGDVVGNNTTLYTLAPASFNYDTATTMQDIADAFDQSSATKTVQPVVVDNVYLAKIRNLEHYVAIKITAAVTSGANSINEVFFDFDYKYPSNVLSTEDFELASNVSIYPQPVVNGIINLTIENNQQISSINIYDINGREMYSSPYDNTNNRITVYNLASGIYVMKLTSDKGNSTKKIVVN